jgi:hypothetical protein
MEARQAPKRIHFSRLVIRVNPARCLTVIFLDSSSHQGGNVSWNRYRERRGVGYYCRICFFPKSVVHLRVLPFSFPPSLLMPERTTSVRKKRKDTSPAMRVRLHPVVRERLSEEVKKRETTETELLRGLVLDLIEGRREPKPIPAAAEDLEMSQATLKVPKFLMDAVTKRRASQDTASFDS